MLGAGPRRIPPIPRMLTPDFEAPVADSTVESTYKAKLNQMKAVIA
jgi:hypothetical protein